jgi:hypothetical protein
MALPNDNISTAMVRNALGENTYNIGKLCTSSKINEMSIYKPVGQRIPQDEYDGIQNYGLRKPFNIVSDYTFGAPPIYRIGVLTNISNPWVYDRPLGSSSSPYRLGDFRGYEHNKVYFPFSNKKVPIRAYPSAIYAGSNISISCLFRYDVKDFNGNLGLGKIFEVQSGSSAPADGAYFGLVARTKGRLGAPCYVLHLSGKVGAYDSETGSDVQSYVSATMPVATNPHPGQQAQSNIFHRGETIEIVPVIGAYGGSVDSSGVPYLRIFSLRNLIDDISTFEYVIPSTSSPTNQVKITSVSFTVIRGAAPGYDSSYNSFQLGSLTINISKSSVDTNISFVGNISLSPTGEVNMPVVEDGTLVSNVPLADGSTSAQLNESIISNRGATQPFRPYIILKATDAITLSLSFRYLENGSETKIITKSITVPPL